MENNKTKGWLFENINKIAKHLDKPTKKKDSNCYCQDERQNIDTEPLDIKMIKKIL